MPNWIFDMKDIVLTVTNRHIQIEEQLNEVEWEDLKQRHVLAVGRYMDTRERVLLKIRYE